MPRRELESDRRSGRWVRPEGTLGSTGDASIDAVPVSTLVTAEMLRELFSDESRERVQELTALERQLEDRIRARWEETESDIRRRQARASEEVAARRRDAERTLREERERARQEGRNDGFREGFEKGTKEGRRLGLEQGRLEGVSEGRQQGRLEEQTRSRSEIRGALQALAEASHRLDEERQRLAVEALEETTQLAIEIARKLVKREIQEVGDPVLRNVEKAVELAFRRGRIALELHPLDVQAVEDALAQKPRWVEDFETIEVRSSLDVDRGGCRLIAGGGSIDLTLESQLDLIERSLLGDLRDEGPEPAGGIEGASEFSTQESPTDAVPSSEDAAANGEGP